MESQVFDIVMSEKEKAIAKFNSFRRIANLRQIFEVVVVLGLISWSSAARVSSAAGYFVEVSAYLFNHHVVFLIGNAIIVLLFVLCRRNDAASSLSTATGDFYDDYLKHSEAVHHQSDPAQPPAPCPIADAVDATSAGDCATNEEKQIVACPEAEKSIPQCDDISEAIAKAERQMKRFMRTQSENRRREITVKPKAKLRRAETQKHYEAAVCAERLERLNSEEFRREIDAFIDKHWGGKKEFNGRTIGTTSESPSV